MVNVYRIKPLEFNPHAMDRVVNVLVLFFVQKLNQGNIFLSAIIRARSIGVKNTHSLKSE